MGRLKQPRQEPDLPSELLVNAERLEKMIADQEAGACFYGDALLPAAKRSKPPEPSFLLYTTQQFYEHTALTTTQQRLYANVLCAAELAAAARLKSRGAGAAGSVAAPGSAAATPQPLSLQPQQRLGSLMASGQLLGMLGSSSMHLGGRGGGGGGGGGGGPGERLGQLEDELILTARCMGLDWAKIARDFLPRWTPEGVHWRYSALMEDKVQQAQQDELQAQWEGLHSASQDLVAQAAGAAQQRAQRRQESSMQAQWVAMHHGQGLQKLPAGAAQQGQLPPPQPQPQPPQTTVRRSVQLHRRPAPALPAPMQQAQQQQQGPLSQAQKQQQQAQLPAWAAAAAAAAEMPPPPAPASAAGPSAAPSAPAAPAAQQPPAAPAAASAEEPPSGQAPAPASDSAPTLPASVPALAPRSAGNSPAGSGMLGGAPPAAAGPGAAAATALLHLLPSSAPASAPSSSGAPLVSDWSLELAAPELDGRCTDPENGELRVCMRRTMPAPPPSTTVAAAHSLPSLEGVRFYEEACVVDRDKDQHVYIFSLRDPAHCARIDMGKDAAGNVLLSFSQVHALYQLPDGTAWVEHSQLVGPQELEALARQRGLKPPALPPPESRPAELYRMVRRCHSRLQNVAGECWVYRKALPYALPAGAAAAAYVWRRELDPATLQPLEGHGG